MELIHQYGGSLGLKHYSLNHEDNEHFKRFIKSQELIDRLKLWLQKNNEKVIIEECYDSQSGWQGASFEIRGNDLSLNGYCFSESRLSAFLYEN